jgi:DNA invertase Pin-like site-specific DNA recombinase
VAEEMDNSNQKKIKAALYSRIASGHPADADAVNIQKDALRSFADKNSFDAIIEYSDIACSGLTFDNRCGFDQLNADIDAGKINTVVVKSIDRISRNIFLTENWISQIEGQGATFLTLDGSQTMRSMINSIMSEIRERIKRKRLGSLGSHSR